jgi:hypothetical protein
MSFCYIMMIIIAPLLFFFAAIPSTTAFVPLLCDDIDFYDIDDDDDIDPLVATLSRATIAPSVVRDRIATSGGEGWRGGRGWMGKGRGGG